MAKQSTCVLVGDATNARLFEVTPNRKRLTEVWPKALSAESPASRDIASDRPGRAFNSAGRGRHTQEPRTDPHRYEKTRFAHHVAHTLDEERKKNTFVRLILVAPPQFLGDLRAALPEPLSRCVSETVDKELTSLDTATLEKQLANTLRP